MMLKQIFSNFFPFFDFYLEFVKMNLKIYQKLLLKISALSKQSAYEILLMFVEFNESEIVIILLL